MAVLVRQDLDLDVLGVDEEFLHEDIPVAERFEGLSLDEIEVDPHLLDRVTAAHTASAAAGCCLQDDREPEFPGPHT